MARNISFKRGETEFELDTGSAQITTDLLCRMFSVDPKTVWLRDDVTNRAYIPDNRNCFDLRNERFSIVTTLYVGGSDYNPDAASTSSSSALTLSATQSHGSSASHHGPGFRSVVPGHKHSGPKYSVKIVKARMEKTGKRFTFEKGEVTYVEIRESSANVDHISREIQLLWGDEYRITTSDGMEVKDCSGTRGLNFWKQNSRKFYAVPEFDLSPGGSSRKRKRSTENDPDPVDEKLDDIMDELDGVGSTLRDVKGKLDKVFALTKNTRVPLCFKQLISESFCCKICHVVPMKPPVIFALCCKTIVGCQRCVDDWYTSAEREEVQVLPCLQGRSWILANCSTERPR